MTSPLRATDIPCGGKRTMTLPLAIELKGPFR